MMAECLGVGEGAHGVRYLVKPGEWTTFDLGSRWGGMTCGFTVMEKQSRRGFGI